MTIDIHKPELAALIQQRMEAGRFVNVEDLLMQVLKADSYTKAPSEPGPTRTGADLIKAMQAMPYKDTDIEPSRPHLPVRDVTL